MSEQGSAHKSPLPSSPPKDGEKEYQSIYSAMMETVQGRRFLDEFARRHAAADTAARAESAAQDSDKRSGPADSLDLFLFDVADMAQAIARTKAEIASIRPPPRQDHIGEATGELHSIVSMTEGATSRILAAAERMQEIAWTLRERGVDETLCDQLDAQATEIHTACSFQDLTGQRTRKVIQVLRYLEYRINAMIELWSRDSFGLRAAGETQDIGGPPNDPAAQALPAQLDQTDVDAVMQPAQPPVGDIQPAAELQEPLQVLLPDEAEHSDHEQPSVPVEPPFEPAQEEQRPDDERQDATLEDIERFMVALEPFAETAHEKEPAVAAEPAEPAGPLPEFAERKPELSVTAAIMNEIAAAMTIPAVTAPAAPDESNEGPFSEAGEEWAYAVETEASAEPVAVSAPEESKDRPQSQPKVGEFGIAARSTAVLLQVHAAASQPADESAWSVLERMAFDFLPQPAAAKKPASEPMQAPEPASALERALVAGPLMPVAEIDLPQAPVQTKETMAWTVGTAECAAVEAAPPEPAPMTLATEATKAAEPEQPAEAKPQATSDSETDEFLFAPEPPQESGPANFSLEPKTEPAPSHDNEAPPDTPIRPAEMTAARPVPRATGRLPLDPLAPLRALSDEEKIALFS